MSFHLGASQRIVQSIPASLSKQWTVRAREESFLKQEVWKSLERAYRREGLLGPVSLLWLDLSHTPETERYLSLINSYS